MLKYTQALAAKVGSALLAVSARIAELLPEGSNTNRYRRIPPQTRITQRFDFSDDDSSAFATVKRTYALRNTAYADAFARINADLDARWLGPDRRRREALHFCIILIICVVLAFAGWCMQARWSRLSQIRSLDGDRQRDSALASSVDTSG
jgi:hypothetical protein